ncbi:MAG: hypothetical protein JW717_12840 [Marinilabiliaceae bacterium]|nr:hypothetical protein [Marinilabiliaceae bacterium]
MFIEVSEQAFLNFFQSDPTPFVSNSFLKINESKVDKIIRFVDDTEKPELGFVAGIRDHKLLSPYSAPFGGFHFKKQNIYSERIDIFIVSMKEFFYDNNFESLKIVLPPDLYHQTFNAKCINSLFRAGFKSAIPEVTSWIDLREFDGRYTQKNSREYYRQAERNKLVFSYTDNENDKVEIYELIKENRAKFGRPIYMTLNDIKLTGSIWPVDFFKVTTPENNIVSGGIFYRFHNEICFAVFWGDNEEGRSLRAMDYMLLNLWTYYKKFGFNFIDLGISTENSVPNTGLLRFKETHEAQSSLKYTFELTR